MNSTENPDFFRSSTTKYREKIFQGWCLGLMLKATKVLTYHGFIDSDGAVF